MKKIAAGLFMLFSVACMIFGVVGFNTMGEKWPVLIGVLGIFMFMVSIPLFIYAWEKETSADTQRIITDKALLQLFEAQPGGILSAQMIAEMTDLTVSEARARTTRLTMAGILTRGLNQNNARYFYELTAALEDAPGLTLSNEPYLTIADLQKIFAAYDHKVSPQDLIMATSLPWNVIARELEYFRKEGVIEVVKIKRSGDSPVQYLLLEPYLYSDKLNLAQADRINEEVRQVLYDENYLV